jgi:hypothetical protein
MSSRHPLAKHVEALVGVSLSRCASSTPKLGAKQAIYLRQESSSGQEHMEPNE